MAPLFREWLEIHYPERAGKVMSVVRQMRGGCDYDPAFLTRMKPRGAWAELFGARFRHACRRAGIAKQRAALDTTRFRPPAADGQLNLL